MKKVYKVENGKKTEIMQFGTWGNAKKFVKKVFGECEISQDNTGMRDVFDYETFKIVVE